MKTLFTNIETKNFDNFSFDVLTAEELVFIKGGDSREDDSYADPLPRPRSFMRMYSFSPDRERTN